MRHLQLGRLHRQTHRRNTSSWTTSTTPFRQQHTNLVILTLTMSEFSMPGMNRSSIRTTREETVRATDTKIHKRLSILTATEKRFSIHEAIRRMASPKRRHPMKRNRSRNLVQPGRNKINNNPFFIEKAEHRAGKTRKGGRNSQQISNLSLPS